MEKNKKYEKQTLNS